MSGYHHRSTGTLKQENKGHKTGGHGTKRELDRANAGRVEKSSVAGSTSTKKSVKSLASEFGVVKRVDRVNRSKQLAEQRRLQAVVEKRLAGGFGPPKHVVVFGLSTHARPESIVATLLGQADAAGASAMAAAIGFPIAAVYNALRTRLLITIAPRPGAVREEGGAGGAPLVYDVTHALAAAQAADVLIVVVDMSRGPAACVDGEGDLFLSCLKAVGLPSVVGVVTGLHAGSAALKAGAGEVVGGTGGEGQGKGVPELRKYATRLLRTEFGEGKDECRVVEVEGREGGSEGMEEDGASSSASASASASALALALARTVTSLPPRPCTWRGHRSYMTPLHAEWTGQEGGHEGAEPTGTLRLYGYLRGLPLNVGQLVTLARGGTYALTSVSTPPAEAHPFRMLAAGRAGAASAYAKAAALLTSSHSSSSSFTSTLAALAPYGSRLSALWGGAGGRGGVAQGATLLAERGAEEGEDVEAINSDVDVDAGEQTWPLDADEDEEEGDEEDMEEEDEEDEEGEGEGEAAVYSTGALVGMDKGSAEYAAAKAKLAAEEAARAGEERARLKERGRAARLAKRAGKMLEGVEEEEEEEEGEEEGGEEGEEVGEESGAGGAVPAPALSRSAAEAEYRDFPDEVDAPLAAPARVRFGRYRGLKSFRTSPWDVRESLPASYAHLFALPKFHRTQARVLREGSLAMSSMASLEGGKVAAGREERKAKGAAGRARAERERKGAAAKGAGAGGDAEMETGGEGDGAAAAGAGLDLGDLLGPGWVAPGQYVCLSLSRVPGSAVADAAVLPRPAGAGADPLAPSSLPGLPLSLLSLLRHEGRASVLHTTITRWPAYTAPVKSRDSLEVYIWGSRLVDARPVLSSPDGGGTDRCRLTRFLLPGTWASASLYGPITYTPAPVLVFRRVPVGDAGVAAPALVDAGAGAGAADLPGLRAGVPDDAAVTAAEEACRSDLARLFPAPDRLSADEAGRRTRLVLVATGRVSSVDPDRLLLKRAILTGFPVKVEGRFAGARAMFFNPEDIDWFKPIGVHTRSGAQGHITESVGTHGRMKLRFDRPISQADVICLPLYKRVFPRWGRGYKAAYPVLEDAEKRTGTFAGGAGVAVKQARIDDDEEL